MNYAVRWTPEAEDQPAGLRVAATDRSAVTTAARRVDQLLGLDPTAQGEQRDGDDRLLFVPPLSVLFRVVTSARAAWVIAVGWSGRPV